MALECCASVDTRSQTVVQLIPNTIHRCSGSKHQLSLALFYTHFSFYSTNTAIPAHWSLSTILIDGNSCKTNWDGDGLKNIKGCVFSAAVHQSKFLQASLSYFSLISVWSLFLSFSVWDSVIQKVWKLFCSTSKRNLRQIFVAHALTLNVILFTNSIRKTLKKFRTIYFLVPFVCRSWRDFSIFC